MVMKRQADLSAPARRSRLVRNELAGSIGELLYAGVFRNPAGNPRLPQRVAFLGPEGAGRV